MTDLYEKSDNIQYTTTAIAIIAAVVVRGSVLIAATRGTFLVASKARTARVVTTGPIMGCHSITEAGVVWVDCPLVIP